MRHRPGAPSLSVCRKKERAFAEREERAMQPAPPARASRLRFVIPAIPIAALTVALPFANRIEPTIAGIPFVLCWIVAWAIAAPAFLWLVGRVEKRW